MTTVPAVQTSLMGHASSDTSLRLIQLLRLVPRHRKKSVRELQLELDAQGYSTSVRTVQRDLEKLAELFPIESDGAKPAGWRWTSGAADMRSTMRQIILDTETTGTDAQRSQ